MPDFDLTILGGGAIGLSAAYLAARAGHRVLVLESSARVGGLLSTFSVGGSRLEQYYHHFFSHDVELRWLVDELGIGQQLQFYPTSMGVFRNGAHHPFNGPRDLLTFSPISFLDRIRFAASSVYLARFVDWRSSENTSAFDWFYRYSGKRATEAIWRPMLEIKFGPHARDVPVAWMAGRLRQRLNSRERGVERLGYIQGSLQVLLDTLLTKLSALGVTIRTNSPATALDVRDGRVVAVKVGAESICTGSVLATIPAAQFEPLVRDWAPDYAARLAKLRYFGAVCTVLELDRALSETYWLNVADPGFPFGGVIEHTNLIPASNYGGRHLVYLSRYFETGNELGSLPKDEVQRRMIDPLHRIYPEFKSSNLRGVHLFRTATAATVCDLNYSQKVPPVRTPVTNLGFASMVHVYPDERSTNNAIRIAANACRSLRLETSAVPECASLSAQIGFE